MSEAIIIRRKIEKSCEATLNVGDMQFLKLKSLMSQDVEGTAEEITKADRALWHEVAMDVRRGMWTCLSDLGKTTDADKVMFESCRQRVEGAKQKKEG
jgi:hypothetical protein